MEKPSWASGDLDIEQPSPARVYDCFLGGSHNFASDRRVARQAMDLFPELPLIMQANRAFLRRSVRYLIRQGITQFLDLGSGIPTEGNVHEVAQVVAPRSRILYVDIDPVAVAHSQAMLAGNPLADIIQADLRDMEAILDNPRARRLLDLYQPIGVLMVGMLHFLPDEADPAHVIAQYRKVMVPSSYLVVSHGATEGRPDQGRQVQVAEVYRRAGVTLRLRSRCEVEALLDGFVLVPPGAVFLPLWRPDSPADVGDQPERIDSYAVVGRRE